MSKKIIIGLIVLIVAGFGYFYFNKNQQSKSEQAGWLTYTNKDLGISFDYPPAYKIYQTGEKTLKVSADYKDPRYPYSEIAMVVQRVAITAETTEQIEARFKPNPTAIAEATAAVAGLPAGLRKGPEDVLNKTRARFKTQTYSSQNKGNYSLFRVEDSEGVSFYLQSDKGTFTVLFSLSAGKIDYQNYENQFNQIIDSIKIN